MSPTKLGPFRFIYTEREQGERTTLDHLVDKYGIKGAQIRIKNEMMKAAWHHDLISHQYVWWSEIDARMTALLHSLNWGQKVGIH